MQRPRSASLLTSLVIRLSLSWLAPLTIYGLVQMPSVALAIELRREVFVENDDVTLADVVVASSVNAEIQQSLRAIVLSPAPAEDEEIVLTATQVSDGFRQAARSQAGANANLIMDHAGLKIPSEIRVHRAFSVFNETHFREQLMEALQLDCSDCKFEITRVRLPPNPVGMEGAPWRINIQNQRVRGPFSVRVDFRKGTQIITSEFASGDVRIYKTVAVLNKAIDLGERIQPNDFVFKPVDATFWNDSPLSQNELLGARLKRSLRSQDPIQRSDIERERLIQKGEQVEIHILQQGLDVGMTGVAQDAGQLGDVIRVLNPQTKKQLNGVVVSKGIVELK